MRLDKLMPPFEPRGEEEGEEEDVVLPYHWIRNHGGDVKFFVEAAVWVDGEVWARTW